MMMFRLGVIEESLEIPIILGELKQFLFTQRIEEVPDDPIPIWHTNEYHIPDERIKEIADVLAQQIKLTWYAHAFNSNTLFVILKGKVFTVSPHKDETWNEMLVYAESVKVEKRYIESIPLSV
jgi:hypothetical protein